MAKVTHLVTQFQPESYSLFIDIDEKAMKFKGEVEITGKKVGRPSQRLTLHGRGLRITAAAIQHDHKKGRDEVVVDRVNIHRGYEEIRLHTKTMLYPGNYCLTLSFSGDITRPMEGIYPSFNNDGELAMIATQFESHYAREVFPCIDEPEAKATFELSLKTSFGSTVLSNSPVRQSHKSKDGLVTVFETTPKMSTYLLAFVCGDLKHKEARTKNKVAVRIWSTPDKIDQVGFALETAVKCLDFYDNYFGIPYPLTKCDMVALPDFAAGAMENWGLITYRENALLIDPDNTPLHSKQYTALVIAHELAHQWFGNLVTMNWWTDLWLNEGFASWIEYLATDALFPDWQLWTQFIASEQRPVMGLDALEHTHPIEVPINHPDEIRSIFDAISYNKGASVIHMLHAYLGAEDFRRGLQYYLKNHAYGNTDTVDLWSALEKSSSKPVKNFMSQWTGQAGLPVVRVQSVKNEYQLNQERFFFTKPAHTSRDTWPIPIQASDGYRLFEQLDTRIKPGQSQLINPGATGFYITSYDEGILSTLLPLAASGLLSEVDRLALLHDGSLTAKAGLSSTLGALQLLNAYRHETSLAVWEIMAGLIGDIRRVMGSEELREAMKPFMRRLSFEQVDRLGWESRDNESHFDTLLRPLALGVALSGDEPAVRSEALRQFDAMKSSEDVHPDIRGIVYAAAARNGDKKTFDKLWRFYTSSDSPDEKVMLTAALTDFKQPNLIKAALGKIKTSNVRLQDVSYWIAYSFLNYHAKDLSWEWLTSNYSWLRANLGSDLSFFRYPIYSARPQHDAAFLRVYEKFWQSKREPALERSIAQGGEQIRWQAAWYEREYAATLDFFRKDPQ